MRGAALQETRQTKTDESAHLAKVRVAGLNPVFRSIGAGQWWFLFSALLTDPWVPSTWS